MVARLALFVCALGLLTAAGCGPGKLNVTQTLSLDAMDVKAVDLPAHPKPQTVTVEYASSADDVTAYAVKAADAPELEAVARYKEKALVSKAGKGETFAVEVPANTAVRFVFVGGAKKADVTVKLTNAK